MTADDLRALATAAHLHDRSYVVLVDWLVNHADALADLIEWAQDAPHHDDCTLTRSPKYGCSCGRDGLAALEADRGTVAEYEADDRG